jgi:hypothetical protein
MPNRVSSLTSLRAALCLSLACSLMNSSVANAAEPRTTEPRVVEPEIVSQQTREFEITVDGKVRGTQTMTIARRSDGSEVLRGEAGVEVNVVLYKYRYSSTGTELWKDGRLLQLIGEADYNGEKYVLKGSATRQGLNYEINGEPQKAPADVWSASYWREPKSKPLGQKLQLLDSDKGRLLTATLTRIEPNPNSSFKGTHYRLRGDVTVDVWYDREGLLVRQELVESGHKTLIELTEVHPGPPTNRTPPRTAVVPASGQR